MRVTYPIYENLYAKILKMRNDNHITDYFVLEEIADGLDYTSYFNTELTTELESQILYELVTEYGHSTDDLKNDKGAYNLLDFYGRYIGLQIIDELSPLPIV